MILKIKMCKHDAKICVAKSTKKQHGATKKKKKKWKKKESECV